MTNPRRKINRVWPILGGVTLILVSLGVALDQTRTLNRLLKEGARAEAVVVDVAVGVKGGKKAVLEFEAADGQVVRTKDMFTMMFVRHRKGESVTVLYDPADPSRATIDIGGWMWQQPGFLAFSALFLTGLLFFILKVEKAPL